MNSSAFAAVAAATTCSRVAEGRPYAMFSAMLARRRTDSWSTTLTCARRDRRVYARTSRLVFERDAAELDSSREARRRDRTGQVRDFVVDREQLRHTVEPRRRARE